jgi:hypothetical protein
MTGPAHVLKPRRFDATKWACNCDPRRLLTEVQAQMHAHDTSGRMEYGGVRA